MSVDFSQWAIPALPITLGGRTYEVRPPSVADMRKLLACAVRAEVNLGIVKGPIPDDVQAVLETIGPDDHPALGKDVYEEMAADGVHPTTIDRMAYYAIFYWARSKTTADVYATALWTPRAESSPAAEEEPDLPKAPPTSRRSSGRGSGSATRSTKTTRGSRSTPTTGSPPA